MSDQVTTSVPEADGVVAGQRLKAAREQAGLHVVALAAALKVPVKKLEALEAGRLSELPDATFARALASSVCRQLKLDPTDILAALPQSGASRLGEEGGLNTPFRSPREPAAPSMATQVLRRPLAAALAILVGAALVWWWVPQPTRVSSSDSGSAATVAPAESGTSMGSVATVGEEINPSVSQPTGDSPIAASMPPGAVAGVTPAAPPAPATGANAGAAGAPALTADAAPTPTSAPNNPSAATSPAGDWFQLRAKGESWVEVRSGNRLVLQRLLKAEETVGIPDSGPLAVVIGRADVVEVLVRGQPLDVSTVARNNVARFEAK